MTGIVYYLLLLPAIYCISWLPFRILYILSDIFYLGIYYVFRYRKKVVFNNLRNAFPTKSEEEIQAIAKSFYHFLCDLFLEVLKMPTISKKSLGKRCVFEDLSPFDRIQKEERSFIFVMGHFGNWEWAGTSINIHSKARIFVIYKPLKNKYIDQLIYKMRTRFGAKAIAIDQTLRSLLTHKNRGHAIAFIADQVAAPESAYWTSFMNQDTPVYWGPEKIARKFNYPIVFASVKRVKRGYYRVSTEMLVEEPQKTQKGEITELHTRKLEEEIQKDPAIWLWSHKRWKFKRESSLSQE